MKNYWLKISGLLLLSSILIGLVIAFFLVALDWVTQLRFKQSWIFFLLPMGGLLIHILYKLVGKSSEKGNILILEEIHFQDGRVSWFMTPLILITTLITHLLGGSAGREGTAVQMGGSIASLLSKLWDLKTQKIPSTEYALILCCGLASGFAAVFGTPIAATIFALEVLIISGKAVRFFLPCLASSLISNWVVQLAGIHHTQYSKNLIHADVKLGYLYFPINWQLWVQILLISVAFGLSSSLFTRMVGAIKGLFGFVFSKKSWLIPFIGGGIIIGITTIIEKTDYLGLGVIPQFPNSYTLPSAFYPNGSEPLGWLWKTLYTSITLGSGFKGGEVTPLFYIGASLGNSLATLLNGPTQLFAALGFVGVFTGASKTPIAGIFLGIELFGLPYAIFFLLTCIIASRVSDKKGIYHYEVTSLTY